MSNVANVFNASKASNVAWRKWRAEEHVDDDSKAGADQIFAGVRVIDVGHVLAGPMTSSFLADFGADVIHIEAPAPERDSSDPVINRGKRCITLNLSRPEAVSVFHRLVAVSDVLTENFRPSKMEAWGHGWDVLHEINPRLVYARMPGYGLTGPYAHRRAYGMIGEAFSGWSWINGFHDGPAMHSSFSWGDTLSSQYAAMAIAMALRWRDTTSGKGQLIDQGLVEPMFRQIEQEIIVIDQTGQAPMRAGTTHEANQYADVCITKDGEYFSYSATTKNTIAALLKTLGIVDQTEGAEDFRSAARGWFSERTLSEVEEAFVAGEACGTRAMNTAELVADPHLQSRDMVIDVRDATGGRPIRMQGVVPKFSLTPGHVKASGARPGQHNEEVYGELLGMSLDEMRTLRRSGVI
jgi:crotonobetainyl-CoA:carnitine CoA-transferase CaiB-like acyl-CoA transferase